MAELWGSDTTISIPTAPSKQRPILIDLGGSGFGFTAGGIAHTVSQSDIEELQIPAFAPPMSQRT
jgi:hypothetical protein